MPQRDRRSPITFVLIEQKVAHPQDPPRTTGADESIMKGAVAAFPVFKTVFAGHDASIVFFEKITGADNHDFPTIIAVLDRFAERMHLKADARLRNVPQFVERKRRYGKALLAFLHHEPVHR